MFDLDTTVTLPLIVSVLAIAFTWYRTRRSAVDELFRAGRKRMETLDSRLSAVEQTLGAMPNKEHLHELQLAIERQTGALNTMQAVMTGNNKVMERLEQIVSRHEDHLLNGASK
ncbi:DUF2730 family protein [Antarcticimicrobium sediminis]|uniref:DUF2730 family protein n=1 Tax=Antarcticimicrobium sediminis TaxID=2546227 RepID=A0A4R5F0Z5_9RHOB|nr:DUF2730 family protein [Antarcticimicrobium sediminis]TDE40942.1 DUF2730 family protein [Antarcticimicrobium sediminis]